MGVNDLMKLLKIHCPKQLHTSCQKRIQTVWIDTPLLIVAAAKIAESENKDAYSLIELTLTRTLFKILGLFPEIEHETKINWIFDGKRRNEKVDTVYKRSLNHAQFTLKCLEKSKTRHFSTNLNLNIEFESFVNDSNELENDLDFADKIINFVSTNPSTYTNIHNLTNYAKTFIKTNSKFTNSNVQVAKHDSEEHIARLMLKDDLAITSDSDALPFGCSHVVQHFGTSKETWIELHLVLENLKFSIDQFRILCVLLGNDFNSRIYKQGPISSFEEVKEFKDDPIDFLKRYALKHNASNEWLDKAQKSFSIFSGNSLH